MKENDAFCRYANALFHLDSSTDLDHLLTACVHLMEDTPTFASFLENPHVTLQSKQRVLETCIQNPLLIHFLMVLLEHKRLKDLPKIARYYHKLQFEKQNHMEAQLVTARPINGDILSLLKLRLEKVYGKAFFIQSVVDPRLIGGAILHVGNAMLDFSLKGRLTELKNKLLRGVHAT